jgi:hypothetical protein
VIMEIGSFNARGCKAILTSSLPTANFWRIIEYT